MALGVTVGAQVLVAFVQAIAPVFAPDVAPQLGVPPGRVGVFIALTYLSAIVCGVLMSPWMMWVGAARFAQFLLVGAAAGTALATIGSMMALLLAAAAIGFSMGCTNPAMSAILARHAPPGSTALFFSLRLAAAAVGIALAGFLLPPLLVWVGWRNALWLTSIVCVVASLLVARAVPALERPARVKPGGFAPASSLRKVIRDPVLRRLGVVSVAYGMAQQGFLTYSVLLLTHKGVPIAAAAGLLAVSQVAAVAARIVLGHAADRWMTPRRLLAGYGVAIALGCFALAALPAAPSELLAALAMIACAVLTMGWYGQMLAHLLRVVPREELASSTGGTQVFMFLGCMLGPYFMSHLLEQGYSYAVGFATLGATAAAAGISLLVHRASREAERCAALRNQRGHEVA
jgi:MFS family permease